jgi:hypothetical protein
MKRRGIIGCWGGNFGSEIEKDVIKLAEDFK